MFRFKPIDRSMKLLPIDLFVQMLLGTFEHALSHPIDEELDLRPLDAHFKNDHAGAPTYAPRVMIRIILHSKARGSIAAIAVR